MERKIGEIFEFGGEWYQCVEGKTICSECDLRNIICQRDTNINNPFKGCSGNYRTDKRTVIFKKLEKVGEPFTISGTLYQHYKVFDIDNVCGDGFWCVHNYNAKTLTIEIKQTKEDMEEKKQKLDKLLEDYSFNRIPYEVFDNCLKQLFVDKQIGENNPSLKEFDFEAAKSGKPVCTRDGRKARIICFDAKGNLPIIALVESDDEENTVRYSNSGRFWFDGTPDKEDLMMLHEKKEGWVNVDKGGSGKITISSPYSTKEEAIHNDNETTIDTIKIYWEE